MYHREHDEPAASPYPPGDGEPVPSVSPVPSAAGADEPGHAGLPRLHDCLWTALVDAGQGFLLLLNSDHVCVYASPEVRTVFGCSPRSLIGARPETFLEPDQLPQVWRARAAVASGAQDVLARLRWRTADGQDRWFDAASGLVRDPATGIEYTAVRGRDVSHEVELQVALSRSEQRHASLLGTVDHAVLQLDAELRIESFNQQALRLLGRAPDELLGRSAWPALDLRDPDGRPVLDAGHPALGPVAGRADPWCTVAAADGQRSLVRARMSSFAGSRPEDGGYLLVFQSGIGGTGAQLPAPSQEQARAAAGLTAREGDVLDGLAAGGDVPTIARWLGISVHSVRGHVKSITAKLGVHSQLQAVIVSARRGLVDLSDEPRMPPAAT